MENIYESKKAFNRAFKEFIWQEHLVELLHGCGWLDGGCRSLMRAIQLWMEDEPIQTYQIVKNRARLHSEHALVRLGKYYLDGDGLSTYHGLYQRWRRGEQFPHVFIRPFQPELEPPNTAMTIPEEPLYIEEESIELIAKALANRFDKKKLVSLMT